MHFGSIYKPILKILRIRYGKNLNLYGIPVIVKSGGAQITIGDNCHIKSSFLSNLVGLSQRSIICARGAGVIEIGNDVGLSGVTVYARNHIVIGDNCLIGGNVKILDNDFHPVNPATRLDTPCDKYGIAPIMIGKNVFIGCNSLVLKGVSIGENSVIGAGSVVSSDIPANCVAAGNPARIVKYLETERKK